jgi:hypothetical protein
MRSKVTQWMHNHSSRRNSGTEAEANSDHYHPMSRAAQQSVQAAARKSTPRSAGAGGAAGESEGSPRRNTNNSEHMKVLMASARQSHMFKPTNANGLGSPTARRAAPTAGQQEEDGYNNITKLGDDMEQEQVVKERQ